MKPFKKEYKPGGRTGGKQFGGERSWDRGSDSRDSGRVIHQAICSECNKSCEVPFKPNGSKPVLCNACFNKDKFSDQKRTRGRFDRPSFGDKPRFDSAPRGFADKGNDHVLAQLRMINDKLDTILRAIN